MHQPKKILIIGGGFSGVACIQKLIDQKIDQNHQITLVSKRPHFEYHAALYRLVAGGSDQETCIPLRSLIRSKNIHLITDEIRKINPENNTCAGTKDVYEYDYLVVAIGSNTSYYHIPGLEKNSYSFKTFSEAKQLKNHLHEIFDQAAQYKTIPAIQSTARITVVGGGASGVELSAELVGYTKKLAKNHSVDENLVKVDLVHSRTHLLPDLPKNFSRAIAKRLKKIGVNLIFNKRVIKEDFNTIFLSDSHIQSKTLVWTAGVTTPAVLTDSPLAKNNDGHPSINNYLQSTSHQNIFISGDNAPTKYTGMAQTALSHGALIAQNLSNLITQSPLIANHEKSPVYAIPLGEKWAAVKYKNLKVYGYAGWVIRRSLDLIVFLKLFPLKTAIACFWGGFIRLENCPECK